MKLKKLLFLFCIVLLIGFGFLIHYRFHPVIYGKLEWLYGKEITVTQTVNLEGTAVLSSELSHGNLVYFSSMGLHLSPKKVHEMHLVSSQMYRSGDYLLVYDREGTTASVFYKNKELYSITTEHRIRNAKVNEEGYSVVICDQPGYQGTVTVYNRKGKNIYRIYSGEKFVLDADVYSRGKQLAVCQYDAKGDKLISNISFYRLDEKEAYEVIDSAETVFTTIRFMTNGTLTAIGDSMAAGFSNNGEETWRYDYQGGALQNFSMSDRSAALVLRQQNQKIVIVRENGRISEHLYEGADIKNISNNKSGVLFATTRDVLFLNNQGYCLAQFQVTRDISELYLEKSGRSGAILYESGYDMMKVK